MPDLPGRRDREDELAAAIRLALGDNVDQWSQGLDSPALRRTVADDVDQILGRAFTDSAIATQQQLDLGVGGVERAAQATGRALGVAVGFSVATSVSRAFDGLPVDASRQELVDAILTSARWGRTAATTVTKAATAGSQYIASAWVTLNGLLVRTIWRTSADARVCPICAPLDGSPADVYSFVSPEGPPAHPNCRCWLDYSWT